MNARKPRIRLVRIFSDSVWCCESCGFRRFGATPRDAYAEWLNAIVEP